MNDIDYLVDVMGYEYNSKGGHITVKFNSGWITRRKFLNVIAEYDRKCSLSGKEVKVGQTGVYFSIKKRGYTRYWVSQIALNQALAGDFKRDDGNESEFVKTLLNYLKECDGERKELHEQDAHLRECIREVKFKQSKLGKRVSATHRLLELVS